MSELELLELLLLMLQELLLFRRKMQAEQRSKALQR
jgi:hypothetical protein